CHYEPNDPLACFVPAISGFYFEPKTGFTQRRKVHAKAQRDLFAPLWDLVSLREQILHYLRSPNRCWSSAVTVIAAVSARRTRPPSVITWKPRARAFSISSSDQPPSEPTRAVIAPEAGRVSNDLPPRSENITPKPSTSSESNAIGKLIS